MITNPELRRLEEIYFNGVINQYTRSNGTKDYGINPEPFSSLHNEINALFDDMEVNFKKETKGFNNQRNSHNIRI